MQTVALGEAWERNDYESLFTEAVRVEPLYDHFYSAKARYLLPRWYGQEGEWERFADQSARTIGGEEGSALYAHLAWEMSRHFRASDFFEQNGVSWSRIRQGYLDREALYGETVRHLNELCLLAGGARDKSTVRAMLPRIGDRWDASGNRGSISTNSGNGPDVERRGSVVILVKRQPERFHQGFNFISRHISLPPSLMSGKATNRPGAGGPATAA